MAGSSPSPQTRNEDSLPGFAFALSAYLFWGILPLYMKALSHIPATEVVAHRVLWSVPVALLVLLWLGRTRDLRTALCTPGMLLTGMLTAALVSANWGIYVWAIASGQTVDAALGYYINPLFSVFLGRVLLGERLSRGQAVAITIAALAVALLTWETGSLPLVSVGLMATWGFYAYFKKSLPIGPNQGFALEVILLLPFALGYVVWLAVSGNGQFPGGSLRDMLLLAGCGLVTALPLMVYANGAKRLRLSTIAMMQYIAPTIVFLIAVFVFDEPFEGVRTIAFPMIWLALVIFTGSMIRRRKR